MRILLVEDQSRHATEARKILESKGAEVTWCGDQSSALFCIGDVPHAFDGAIIDIFIPLGDPLLHFQETTCDDPSDTPCGVGVAIKAEKLKIPFVFCTAGNHHGSKYNWICWLGRNLGWPEIVDTASSDVPESESVSKNWSRAFEVLTHRINASV